MLSATKYVPSPVVLPLASPARNECIEKPTRTPKAPDLTAAEQAELALLRKQMTLLRHSAVADAGFRKEIVSRGGASILGLGMGDDFLVSDDLADFLQLSEEQKEKVNGDATRLLDAVKSWEEKHAVVVEEETGQLLSYKVASADATLSSILDEYTNALRQTVGTRNFDMIAGQVSSLVSEYGKERIITYYTAPNEEGGTAYEFSIEWSDGAGSSGGSDEVGANFSEIPPRWKHLFRMSSQ